MALISKKQLDTGVETIKLLEAKCRNQGIEWENAEPSKEEAFQKVLELLQKQPDIPRIVGILKRVMKNPAMIQKAWVRNAMGDILAALKK